jgi:hypothetical protein
LLENGKLLRIRHVPLQCLLKPPYWQANNLRSLRPPVVVRAFSARTTSASES